MSDEKRYTVRDKVLAMRAAYIEGVSAAGMYHVERYDWHELAAKHYPLPKVTRPRVVQVGVLSVKIENDTLFTFGDPTKPDTAWHSVQKAITEGNVGLATHLLSLAEAVTRARANPTETVEAV